MRSTTGFLILVLLLINIQQIEGRNDDIKYANMILQAWAIIATIGFTIIFILFLFLSLILTIFVLKNSSAERRSRVIILSRKIESKEGIHLDSTC